MLKTPGQLLRIAQEYMLVMNGTSLAQLQQGFSREDIQRVVQAVTTFARTSPQQKTLIVQSLNASGRHTLMCGDGTNDVGSLKAATVGIALTNKEKRKQSAAEKQQNKRLASPFYWPSP